MLSNVYSLPYSVIPFGFLTTISENMKKERFIRMMNIARRGVKGGYILYISKILALTRIFYDKHPILWTIFFACFSPPFTSIYDDDIDILSMLLIFQPRSKHSSESETTALLKTLFILWCILSRNKYHSLTCAVCWTVQLQARFPFFIENKK